MSPRRVLCLVYDEEPEYTQKCVAALQQAQIPFAFLHHKAGNILRDLEGYAMVVQFGLSRTAAQGFYFVDSVRRECPQLRDVPYVVVGGHLPTSTDIKREVAKRNIHYVGRLAEDGTETSVEIFITKVKALLPPET